MNNQLLIRGLVLIVIALCFGVPALTYHVGNFSRAGPGLFPLLVSSIVGVIGVVMIVRACLEQPEPMTFKVKNIFIVLASLAGFVVIAEHFNVMAAVVYLVFVSTLAGSDYSIARNLKICALLIAIAFAFHAFLGLNLKLL
jgi:Tripartite tricarboxylate transporter TctB family